VVDGFIFRKQKSIQQIQYGNALKNTCENAVSYRRQNHHKDICLTVMFKIQLKLYQESHTKDKKKCI
jgi:hypothetical protein